LQAPQTGGDAQRPLPPEPGAAARRRPTGAVRLQNGSVAVLNNSSVDRVGTRDYYGATRKRPPGEHR
jgi:hypothetical protein